MAVTLFRPTETIASAKACKAIMYLFMQHDLERNQEDLNLPHADIGGVESAQCIPGQSLRGYGLESC